jgi:membrane associated rhomboid family serine protease
MVFPISDDNSDLRTVPLVNYALIAINVLVFVAFQRFGHNDRFTYAFATVPEEIRTGKDIDHEVDVEDPITHTREQIPLEKTPVSVYLTLLTSMFLHGGPVHILGNMWFLFIFGDNIEDALGHVRYLLFYLVCGVLASLAHVGSVLLFRDNPFIPSLGASGAISGVLGAYILLFPMNPVKVILFRVLTEVPAFVAVGIWFVFQVVLGLGTLGGTNPGGVAYAAHVGGFVAGLLLVKVFALGHERPA